MPAVHLNTTTKAGGRPKKSVKPTTGKNALREYTTSGLPATAKTGFGQTALGMVAPNKSLNR